MVRTFAAAGAVEKLASDLYIERRPPTTAKFLSQRVRQAYDDFAQPGRLAVEAALLPTIVWLARRRPGVLPVLFTTIVAVAEKGRRKHGGAAIFPRTSAFWAPAWVVERAVCVWLAIGARLRGGAKYGGMRLRNATVPVGRRCPVDPDSVNRTMVGSPPSPAEFDLGQESRAS
jgi:hypothetical protein